MPAYKDETNNTWYVKFYYLDYQGQRKQKKKRGFKTKKAALQWERDFLAKEAGAPDMKFSDLVNLYLQDKRASVKYSTYISQESIIRKWITPYFSDRPVNSITPAEIRQWQIEIKDIQTLQGGQLKTQTMLSIVRLMASLFNFCMKYHDLSDNPVHKAGCIAGKPEKRLNFWTKEQFDRFMDTFEKDDPYYTIFTILYYTGMRKGELQALEAQDIDLANGIIRVSKTFSSFGGQHLVTPPKTSKSNRDIYIPRFLCDLIQDYENRLYDLQPGDRLFYKSRYNHAMEKHINMAGVPRIRLHDLRHSHASLLIEMGFSALLVAERLGHENVTMTLNVYSHLWPSKQQQAADQLQQLHDLDKKRAARHASDSQYGTNQNEIQKIQSNYISST